MDIGIMSVRYAKSLLKSAIYQKIEDSIYLEVQNLIVSYMQVSDLHSAITNPMLSKSSKLELLEAACGNNISDLMKDFLNLVLTNGRGDILLFIGNSYISLYRKRKNIIQAKLTTAVPVTSTIEGKMRSMVEAQVNGTVEFKTKVDPEIIGGFILEYDTYRMDASVKTKLKAVLTELKK